MDQHRCHKHIDSGDLCSFHIGTDCKHVLAEARLVPDEPHHDNQYYRKKHIPGNGDVPRRDLKCRAGYRVFKLGSYVADWAAAVSVYLEEHKDDAVCDKLGRQSDYEGMKAEFGDKEAVYKPYYRSCHHNHQHHSDDPSSGR